MIVRNSVRCNGCGQQIVSETRHDYRTCECGDSSVDGGYSYLRRTFKQHGSYTETSIISPCLGTNEAGRRGVLVGYYLLYIPDSKHGEPRFAGRTYVGHDLETGERWEAVDPTDLENLPQVTRIEA